MIFSLYILNFFFQDGFLLGEVLHKETKTITDNDQQQINISKTIIIKSVLPCPQKHFFYNGTGKIDRNRIKGLLGDQFNKVVAWYKFQKTSSLRFSLRDKIIHKQLIDLFSISPDLFTCCFLINEVSDNGSTHLFSQAFIRFQNNKYDNVPIYIPNLSESNNTYKTPELASFTFNTLLSDLKMDQKTTQGSLFIKEIQNALQNHIDHVIKDLSIEEQHMFELEEEVKQLELKKIKKKNEEEKDDICLTIDNPLLKDHLLLEKRTDRDLNNSVSIEISHDRSQHKKFNQKVIGRSGRE